MNEAIKAAIGARLRCKREQSGYTREQLGEICSLSPRFIANVELGDSTFSLDSLIAVCKALSCSADFLLFGDAVEDSAWADVVSQIEHIDVKYVEQIKKVLQGFIEAINKAEM